MQYNNIIDKIQYNNNNIIILYIIMYIIYIVNN